MSDLPPTWVIVVLLILEITVGVAMVAVPGFLIAWFGS